MAGLLERVSLSGDIHDDDGRYELRFRFLNESAQSLIFWNDFLDPRDLSNVFILVPNSGGRVLLERMRPVVNYLSELVTIGPGECFVHSITLEYDFGGFSRYIAKSDLTLFWSLRLEPVDEAYMQEAHDKLLQGELPSPERIDEADVRVFNGYTIVPQRKELGEE